MDAARRSLLDRQSAVAGQQPAQSVQAQLLAQQQAAAAQQQQMQRGSFAAWNAGATPPMLGAQTSFSGYFPMQAMNMMNLPPMMAIAKLANCNKKKDTNSTLVIRSTVPKLNISGGSYTVAQWARKCVEDNIEWIVKLTRRHYTDEKTILLAYGDGCQTIVLFDEAINNLPSDTTKIKKVSIGVSAADADTKEDESKLAAKGVLQPSDSFWDYLRAEQADNSKDKKDKIMFIHTCMKVSTDTLEGRRRVLQIKTDAPGGMTFDPNPTFEHQLIAKWKSETVGAGEHRYSFAANMAMMPGAAGMQIMGQPHPGMGMAAAAAHVAATTPEVVDDEVLITFNPKELILLEKAFDNALTSRDLKAKADKWSEDDKKNCQSTIARANNEFKWVRVAAKKGKPKEGGDKKTAKTVKNATKKAVAAVEKKTEPKKAPLSTPKKDTKKKEKEAPKSAAKDGKKKTPAKATLKKTPAKESKSAKKKNSSAVKKEPDSDDEPISKLKEKKEAVKKESGGAKKLSKSKAKPPASPKKPSRASTNKAVTPKTEPVKKRGRSKTPVKKEESPAKRTRRSTTSKATKSRK